VLSRGEKPRRFLGAEHSNRMRMKRQNHGSAPAFSGGGTGAIDNGLMSKMNSVEHADSQMNRPGNA